jgi:hypothetical protein
VIFGKHDRFVYVHVPKTGGTTIRELCARNDLGVDIYKNEAGERIRRGGHDWPEGQPIDPDYLLGRGYGPVQIPEGAKVFATVRDPVKWYRSYYQFRRELDFRGKTFAFDRVKHDLRKCPTFPEWVHWIVANYPGLVGRIYRQMIPANADLVWKTSHLIEGFEYAMNSVGLQVTADQRVRENQSFELDILTPELEDLIRYTEPDAIEIYKRAWPEG